MKASHAIGAFAIAGVLIPVILIAATSNTLFYSENDNLRLIYHTAQRWLPILCPSSILLMANGGATPGFIPDLVVVIALLINVMLYSGIGACLWMGRHKHSVFFVLPVILVIGVLKFFHAM
jgi:hypothetical protein